MISIVIVLLVCFLAAYLIIKNYNAQAVLFSAGIALLLASHVLRLGHILPDKIASSGFSLLDPIVFIDSLSGKYAGGLGLMIMVLMGFAQYMKSLKADEAVVVFFTRPLSKIKSPYALLFFAYLVASLLQLAIPSASGLAALLMTTVYPLLIRMGISSPSASGIIASSLSMAYVPTAVDAIRAAAAVNISPVDYVYLYQGRLIVPSILTAGIVHVLWQSYCDRKEGFVPEKMTPLEDKASGVPMIYATLPFLPIVFSIVFSHYLIASIKLSIVSIVILCMFLSMLTHFFYMRNLKQILNGLNEFFKGMGESFASVVTLLIAAGVFSQGIQSAGAVTELIRSSETMGIGAFGLGIVFALMTLCVAIITGSGNAPFLAFIEFIPKIAASLGVHPVSMILPMQQASHMGRSLSPVSGVVIIASGAAKISPFSIVKRVSVPIAAAFVVHVFTVMIYFYA